MPIEHRGEHFTIVRRGKAVAHLEPMNRGLGADVKSLLRRHRPDPDWSGDLDDAPSTPRGRRAIVTRLLFDTTFLIDAERTGDELDDVIDDDDDVAIAAVTIAELRVGALRRQGTAESRERRLCRGHHCHDSGARVRR